MPTIPNQLHASLRGLWRRPVHSLVAVSILALGLSTAVAVFGYLDGFHQPFPGVEARQLVRVFGIASEEPYQDVPHLDFLDYASDASSLEGLAATQPFDAASVRREALTEVAFLEAVSGSYFSVLDAPTVIGRGLTPNPLIAVFAPGEVKQLEHALVLGPFKVGLVLSALVNFVLKAGVVYFFIIRPFASFAARLAAAPPPPAPPPADVMLLTEIRDLLKERR